MVWWHLQTCFEERFESYLLTKARFYLLNPWKLAKSEKNLCSSNCWNCSVKDKSLQFKRYFTAIGGANEGFQNLKFSTRLYLVRTYYRVTEHDKRKVLYSSNCPRLMYSSNVQDCICQNYFRRSNGNKGNVFVVSYDLNEFWVVKRLILIVRMHLCCINATVLWRWANMF